VLLARGGEPAKVAQDHGNERVIGPERPLSQLQRTAERCLRVGQRTLLPERAGVVDEPGDLGGRGVVRDSNIVCSFVCHAKASRALDLGIFSRVRAGRALSKYKGFSSNLISRETDHECQPGSRVAVVWESGS
jgi:hypothetical protein